MSADFSNFGSAALGIAGTAYVVGEANKMLRNAERQARPIRHKNNIKKMKHEQKEPHRTGHTSKGDDYAFDFRI